MMVNNHSVTCRRYVNEIVFTGTFWIFLQLSSAQINLSRILWLVENLFYRTRKRRRTLTSRAMKSGRHYCLVTALRTNFRKVVDKHTIDMNKRWLCTRLPYRTSYTAKSRPDSRLYAIWQIISAEWGGEVCFNRLHFKRAVREIDRSTCSCSKNRNK